MSRSKFRPEMLSAILLAVAQNRPPAPVAKSELEPRQVQFLIRLQREWKVYAGADTGLWLGDLLHRGLIQPYSEGAWDWILTQRGHDSITSWTATEEL